MITDRATRAKLVELLRQQHRAQRAAAEISIASARGTLRRARARLALSHARLAGLASSDEHPQESPALPAESSPNPTMRP